jgi:hypothetical protein
MKHYQISFNIEASGQLTQMKVMNCEASDRYAAQEKWNAHVSHLMQQNDYSNGKSYKYTLLQIKELTQ